MIPEEKVRQLALSFPEAVEVPHFEIPSFRVKKKIFVTMNMKNNRICVRLSLADQDIFSLIDQSTIYPVPNKWGKQGWTLVDLLKVNEEILVGILTAAYCQVAPSNLSKPFLNSEKT